MPASANVAPSSSNEQAFRLLFDNHPTPMWIYDLETLAFLAVNNAAMQHYGYSRDEFLALTLVDIRPEEDVPRLLADIAQARPPWQKSGGWRHRRKDGRVIDVEITSHTLTYNGREAALVMAQDITMPKQAQEALRRSEEQLRLFVEQAPMAIAMFDLDMNYLAVSRRWLRDYSLDAPTIVGRSHYDIFPEIPERWKAVHRRGMSGQVIRVEEDSFERLDGTVQWLRWEVRPWLGTDSVIGGIMIFTEDITERKRAEDQLRESEERFSTAFHANPAALTIARLEDGVMIDVNQSFLELFGYQRDEVIGRSSVELNMYTDPQERARLMEIFHTQGKIRNQELTAQKSSGERLHVMLSTELITLNGVPHVLNTTLDISKRKRAEEQLRYQANLLAEVSDAIISTDMAFRIRSWNKAAESIYGWRAEEVIGKTMREVAQTESEDIGYEDMANQFLQAGRWHGEVIQQVKDGSKRHILSSVTMLHDETGQPSGAVAVNRDITDRKQLEAENERLTAQFYQAQKMESIGRLAGGIAHDFNNLLMPVVGYTELGMQKLTSDNPLYDDLKRIKAAGERAASLTRQILAFSRRQVLEIRVLELNQIIGEFEPMLRRLIGEDIDLQTYLAASPLFVKADQTQLEQVLLNLVVNARDAMPNGGRLTIETAHVLLDEAYAAKHTEVQPGPHALLAVSDTGHGMDLATQQHIFEPFFTTKALGQGTGLGLATVFGIVKQHGGNIWVYSEPDKGSTFKIYLPLAEASGVAVRPEREPSGSLEGTETVLLVEDEASVRQLVGDTLRANGYQVLEAEEPEKGLALAAHYRGQIHLLVTDVIMPTMNGRKLYQQLVMERPELKVLYMSGYTDNVIAHHGVLDEETIFLQKPFTLHGLLQKVRAVLA